MSRFSGLGARATIASMTKAFTTPPRKKPARDWKAWVWAKKMTLIQSTAPQTAPSMRPQVHHSPPSSIQPELSNQSAEAWAARTLRETFSPLN